MYEEKECGVIQLLRNERVDKSVDLLQRDPITMRTYLSLAVECLDKKKDLVLAVVITDINAVPYGKTDFLPSSFVNKGILYFAESINLHRFFVSYTNPNVLSITKKIVKDPTRQIEIVDIYYYSVCMSYLKRVLLPVLNESITYKQRQADGSNETLADILKMLSFRVQAIWIGTENDYEKNSIFHEYVRKNNILEELPDANKRREASIKIERKVLRFCFSFLAMCTAFSLFLHYMQNCITYTLIISHIGIFVLCSAMLTINYII